MKTPRTLILLAADQDFRLLSSSDASHAPKEILHRDGTAFSDVDVEFAERPDRGHSPVTGVQFSHGARQSEDEQERSRFAAHVIDALAKEWAKGGYDRVVISAGPKMLGVLRDKMPAAVKAHVTAELHKDLVKVPGHELMDHLKGAITL